MTIDLFIDRFNSKKIWYVKRSLCGHYWVRQKVAGLWCSSWKKCTVNQMLDIVAG